jgi:hypothetical protein
MVAGAVGLLAGAVSMSFVSRGSGSLRARTFWVVFLAASGGVFALADRLGVLAAPYESASRDGLSLDINSPKPKRNELRGRRTPEQ